MGSNNEYIEAEKFFKFVLSEIDNETILPADKFEKKDIYLEKEFYIDKSWLNDFLKEIDLNTLFLSGILFNLTKFTYNKKILISTLLAKEDNFEKIIIAKNINTDINVKIFLDEINDLIIKTNKYKSAFNEFKKNNNLIIPDFQYYYQNNKDIGNNEDITNENINSFISKSNFTVIVKELENKVKISFLYNDSQYSEKLIDLFYKSLLIIFNKFKEDKAVLKSISIGSDSYEDFKSLEPPTELFIEIFQKQVEDNPDKIALISEDKTLNFDEFNQEVNRIANSLINKGVVVGDRIAVMLNRDSKLITSIYGILKSGGVFLPIDSRNPKERVELMLKNSGAKYIITNNEYLENSLIVDNLLNESKVSNPNVKIGPDDLAYVMFTSGSTGEPKGVMTSHQSLSNYINPNKKNIYSCLLSNLNNYISLTTISFVVFVSEIFTSILNGVTLVLASDESKNNPHLIANLINIYDIQGLDLTPSLIDIYLDNVNFAKSLSKLKIICLGGEAFPPKLYNKLIKFTDAKILDCYGLTETTINSNVKILNDSINISIGKPLFNVIERVIDVDAHSLPAGIIGELWVGGLGVAKGYINNPEINNKLFTKINNIPFYKTGDLVRLEDNGDYIYHGRLDTQFKINGQRVERREIEEAISKNDQILSVHVLNMKLDNTDTLCAYYKLKENSIDDEILKKELNEQLANILPDYMVPKHFILMNEFPLSVNGKLDIKKLPKPSHDLTKILAPSNDLEKEIYKICSDILGYDNFGVNNDFISIGFTSFSYIQLINKIFEEYSVEIKLIPLLKNGGTIKDIAKQITESPTNSFKEDKQELYPMSPDHIYFLSMLNSDYNDIFDTSNLSFCVSFNAESFNAYKLKDALIKTIDINSFIKTYVIVKPNLTLYLKNNNGYKVDIEVHEKRLTEDIINDFFKGEFNLLKPLLFKFAFYCDGKNIFLLIDMHHGISDFYSIQILLDELIRVYNGENFSKDYDYYDYILDYNKNTPKENILKLKRKQIISMFKGELTNLIKKELSKVTGKYKLEDEKIIKIFSFNIKVDEKVIIFCSKYKISESDFVFYILLMALKKFLDLNEIEVNYTFYGRDNPKYVNTIGLFSRNLQLSFKLKDESTESFLKYFKEVIHLKMQNFDGFEEPDDKQNVYITYNYLANMANKNNDFTIKEMSKTEESKTNKNILWFLIYRDDNKGLLVNTYYNPSYYNIEDIEKLVEYVNHVLNTIK